MNSDSGLSAAAAWALNSTVLLPSLLDDAKLAVFYDLSLMHVKEGCQAC